MGEIIANQTAQQLLNKMAPVFGLKKESVGPKHYRWVESAKPLPYWLITAPGGRQHQAQAATPDEALEQAVIALGYSPTAINDEEWEIVPQESQP